MPKRQRMRTSKTARQKLRDANMGQWFRMLA